MRPTAPNVVKHTLLSMGKVVGWPVIVLTGLVMVMALHVAQMEAPTNEEWFIFECLVVKIKWYYL